LLTLSTARALLGTWLITWADTSEAAIPNHATAAKTKFLDAFMVSTFLLVAILPALSYRRKKAK
jgi:hypothetical protein